MSGALIGLSLRCGITTLGIPAIQLAFDSQIVYGLFLFPSFVSDAESFSGEVIMWTVIIKYLGILGIILDTQGLKYGKAGIVYSIGTLKNLW